MNCLFATDLHGNRWLYDRLFDRARASHAGAILLGGDLSPLVTSRYSRFTVTSTRAP